MYSTALTHVHQLAIAVRDAESPFSSEVHRGARHSAHNNNRNNPLPARRLLAPLLVLASVWMQAVPAAAADTEVLVLGTAHLREFKELPAGSLDPLLQRLEQFAPDRIAVEHLPPAFVDRLVQLAELRDVRVIRDSIGKRIADAGLAAQAALGIDAREAQLRFARAPEGSRVEDVVLALAAYRYGTAALRWQQLPDAQRRPDALPAALRDAFLGYVGSNDEVLRLAVPLARARGIRQLDPIDDQSDFLSLGDPAMPDIERVWGAAQQLRREDSKVLKARGDEVARVALAAGDLLPYYRLLNSPLFQAQAALEWQSFRDTGESLGVRRANSWQLRKQRIAGNLAAIAVDPGVRRILLIIGAAHVEAVEQHLRSFDFIHVRSARELLSPAAGLPAAGIAAKPAMAASATEASAAAQ